MPVDTLFPTVTEMAPVTPIASRQVVGVPAMARMIREARGLLVKDLADMVGRSSSYISKVEAGAVELVGEPLQEYARALDVSTDLLATKYQPVPLEGAHFRSHTSTPMRVRKQAVAEANWAHLFLQLLLDLGEFNHPEPCPKSTPTSSAAVAPQSPTSSGEPGGSPDESRT